MAANEDICKEALQKELPGLSLKQLAQFERYYGLLTEWNEKINLTAITAPQDVAVKHFADSLLARQMLNEWSGKSLIDIGTGAGFPGVPLKIAEPSLQLTLFDSLQKRLNFLDILCRELELKDVQTVHGRAEDGGRAADLREKFDIATARAVAKLPVLLEYALPFVKVGGYFLALKGPELEEELAQANKALKALGGELVEVGNFALGDYTRNIALIKKVSPTPKAYPRKAGTPQKKPLV